MRGTYPKYIIAALLGLLVMAAATTTQGSVTTLKAPDPVAFPTDVAVAPGGTVWFTESRSFANSIVKRSTTGDVQKYPIPTPNSLPRGIDVDSGGNVWFVESGGTGKIGKLNPATGVITEYPVPTSNSEPYDIAVTSGGDVWFTMRKADKIGVRFSDGTYGQVNLDSGSRPQGMSAANDGSIWVAGSGNDRIYQWTTARTLRYWNAPAGSAPVDITTDDQGNAWYTMRDAGMIGRILPTRVKAEYSLGAPGAEPFGIDSFKTGTTSATTVPVWFTQAGKVASINACGVNIDESLTASYEPLGIAGTSSGEAWFADLRGNRLVKTFRPSANTALTLSATPGTLRAYRAATTLTGRLTSGSGGLASTAVRILYRQPGGTWYKHYAWVKTDSQGYFSLQVSPVQNTAFVAKFYASGAYEESISSARPCIEVIPKVTAGYSDTSIMLGETIKMSGTVSPSHAGGQVRLERYSSASWVTVATAKLNSSSGYSFTWKPSAAGSYKVRVHYPGDANHHWKATASKVITVN